MSDQKVWLDIAVTQCPDCGRFYADASWYVVEIGSDVECGTCHRVFNTKTYLTDRVMLELDIDNKGKATQAVMGKRV